MPNLKTYRRINVGFFLALLITICASIFSYVLAKRLDKSTKDLERTSHVFVQLNNIKYEILNAEYLLLVYNQMPDSVPKNIYVVEHVERIQGALNKVRNSFKTNEQLQHFTILESLTELKIKGLLHNENHLKKHLPLILDPEQFELNHLIESRIDLMILEEEKLLTGKTELFELIGAFWIPLLLFSSLLAVTLGAYAYWVLRREYQLKIITESRLKLYQRELQQNIRLLNKTNTELEQFAYLASHDLQEPLRKINMFGGILLDKHYDSLNADAKDLLGRMDGASKRMQLLIDDLLKFSRSGRFLPETMSNVDLNAMFLEMKQDLELRLKDVQGVLHVEKMPSIHGNETALRQLFQNLFLNAIKFARQGVPLVLEVQHEIVSGRSTGIVKAPHWSDAYIRIVVKDNGIGFDEKYADKIFQIFQRLHGRSTYSGTGIGLAICKKIVDAHHGYISAKGVLQVGSEFTIILPMNKTLLTV